MLSKTVRSVASKQARFLAASARSYHELSYAEHGEPIDVLTYRHDPDPVPVFPADDQNEFVLVQMLHAPWNPADMNTVQGKYPSVYKSPDVIYSTPDKMSQYFEGTTVAGSEGWGRIISSELDSLPEGTLVTVAQSGLGTLRSSLWAPSTALLPIPDDLVSSLGPGGSSLFQLGGTALRMLKDFENIGPGDVVIQNGGNSAVGLMLSQLAPALLGASVVSVVRRGSKSAEEYDAMVEYLVTTGRNALVLAEEDILNPDMKRDIQTQIQNVSGDGEMPKLAINSVGGPSAQALLRQLRHSGSMVTYGGMSGKPVSVATPQLIFKDLKAVGYWHSRWMVQHTPLTKQHMVNDLVRAVQEEGVVCPPCETFALSDVRDALEWQANQGAIRKKLIFDCSFAN
eukprot:Nitzschia sp. Nitz4//scaffold11_size288233//65462//66652//NITZ4_ECR//-1//CDS//3329534245//5634//frame0